MAKDVFQDIEADKNLVIIGAPKCGTNSLQQYLQKRFPDKKVERSETIYKEEHGVKDFHRKYPNSIPVIILRDEVERIWSQYHYFGVNQEMSIKEYVSKSFTRDAGSLGEIHPIKQSRWNYYIKFWEELKPIIVTLEECKKLEGFPHINKTSDCRVYPNINKEEREIIEEALKNG